MSRSLRLICSLLLAFVAGLPAQEKIAPVTRFERVLWCSDTATGPELASRLGYTSVQVGRGTDPARVRELGLSFYLDQPIGKGMLELRDREWQPVVQQFERTRDARGLIRPGCFATPDRLAKAVEEARAEALRVGSEGMLFVALADEASSTRHNAPLDTCRCEHCLRDFRLYLKRRFPSLDDLNATLGTHYASFDEAEPVGTDPLRRRELGDRLLPADLRAFTVWLDFVDRQFADGVEAIGEAVKQAVPGVPVGLTGLAVPGAFGGHDYRRLLPFQTLAEPYDIGGAVELTRSLVVPGTHRYTTLAPPGETHGTSLRDLMRAHVAPMASQGLTGCVVWNDKTIVGDKGAETPFGKAVRAAFREYRDVLDTCAGATVAPGDVWVVESQASVRAWWMIDSARDGMTWVRRLASYEETHSTSQAARRGWIRLLQDLGHQPHFVIDRDLADRLLIEKPRCVVLPATIAIADRTAQALRAYVTAGGTLIADHSTGIYDSELLRREVGLLDGLFGIAGRSLAWEDLLVREGKSVARESGLPPAEHGLRGKLGEKQRHADTFLERPVGRGHAYYLNAPVAAYPSWRLDESKVRPARELRRRVRGALQRARVQPPCEVSGKGLPTCIERTELRLRDGRRVVAIRVNALERPGLLRRIAKGEAATNGTIEIDVIWPRAVQLRELAQGSRKARDLGVVDKCKARLDPFGAVWFEVGR